MPLAKVIHSEAEFTQMKRDVSDLQTTVKQQQAIINSLVGKLDAAETRFVQLEGALLYKADTTVVKHEVDELTASLESQLQQKVDKMEINERLDKMIDISKLNELEKRMYDLNLAVETQMRDLINTYSVRMETVSKTKADIATMDLALKSKADHMDMKELSEQMLRMDKEIVILNKTNENSSGAGRLGKELEDSLHKKQMTHEQQQLAMMTKLQALEKRSREDRKAREIMEQHQAGVLLQLKKVKDKVNHIEADERSLEGLLHETQKVTMESALALEDMRKEKKRVTVATLRRQQRLRATSSRGSSNSTPQSPLPPISPPPSRGRGIHSKSARARVSLDVPEIDTNVHPWGAVDGVSAMAGI